MLLVLFCGLLSIGAAHAQNPPKAYFEATVTYSGWDTDTGQTKTFSTIQYNNANATFSPASITKTEDYGDDTIHRHLKLHIDSSGTIGSDAVHIDALSRSDVLAAYVIGGGSQTHPWGMGGHFLVDVYVKGPPGTPYQVKVVSTGSANGTLTQNYVVRAGSTLQPTAESSVDVVGIAGMLSAAGVNASNATTDQTDYKTVTQEGQSAGATLRGDRTVPKEGFGQTSSQTRTYQGVTYSFACRISSTCTTDTDGDINGGPFPYFKYEGHSDASQSLDITVDAKSLAAPTNLTVTPVSSTKLDLSWQDPNNGNEDGFKIERKSGNNPYTEIASVDPTPTTYHDTGLTPGTTYTYRVRAYQGSNFSDYSNEASGTTSATITVISSHMISNHQLQIMTKRNFGNQTGHVSLNMTINDIPIMVTEDRDTNVNDSVDQQPFTIDLADYDGNGNSVPRFTSNQSFTIMALAKFDDGSETAPDNEQAAILLPVVIIPGIQPLGFLPGGHPNGGDGTYAGLENYLRQQSDIQMSGKSLLGEGYRLQSDQTSYPTLYTLPYPTNNAPLALGAFDLAGFIQSTVKRNTWADSVNLVTHSKGGLIARQFVETVDDSPKIINRLIMSEPPNLGSIWAMAPTLFVYNYANLYPLWKGVRNTPFHQPFIAAPNLELSFLNNQRRMPQDIPYTIIYSSSSTLTPYTLTRFPIRRIETGNGDEVVPDFSALGINKDMNFPGLPGQLISAFLAPTGQPLPIEEINIPGKHFGYTDNVAVQFAILERVMEGL